MPYPNSFDSLPTNHVDPPAAGSPETIYAAIVNAIAGAINREQQELGLLPKGIYADVATRLAALEYVQSNTITGASYTLSLADTSKIVVCTAAGGCTVTVPAAASVNFPQGTIIVIRAGVASGTITVSPAGGVSLVNPYSSFALAGHSAEAKLLKIGPDAWSLNGEVA
jgi:hypothetical protein